MSNKLPTSALRIGIEFVSGLITGVVLGRGIDHFFNTHPWGLITLIVLGTAAGFLNLYKMIIKNKTLSSPSNQNDQED